MNEFVPYFENQTPPTKEELESDEDFVDKKFPPDRNSLLSLTPMEGGNFYSDQKEGKEKTENFKKKNDLSKIIWKRGKDIENASLFGDKLSIDDIEQGNLGNCYFMSSISAIAKYPKLIEKLFGTETLNKKGFYELTLFLDGEWQKVIVDDNFPFSTETDKFCFSKPKGGKIWVMLLEKAWAKVNGGYTNTESSCLSDALLALTGFPTETLYFKPDKKSEDKEEDSNEKIYTAIEAFERICQDEKDSIIGCSSRNDIEKLSKVNMVDNHAHSLVKIYQDNKNNLNLLLVRNPWGSNKYIGNWSKFDEELIKEFKEFNSSDNNGEFWIDLDSYEEYFKSTVICHVTHKGRGKTYRFSEDEQFDYPNLLKLKVKEEGKFFIMASFKKRMFHRFNLKDDPIYPFGLVIVKFNKEKEIEFYDSDRVMSRDLTIEKTLKKGTYLIWIYCPKNDIKNDEGKKKYLFTVISEKLFSLHTLSPDKDYHVIYTICLKLLRDITSKEKAEKDKIINSIHNGVISPLNLYYFKNLSETEILNVTFELETTNCTIFPIEKTSNLCFLPGQDMCVLAFINKPGVSQIGAKLSYFSYPAVNYNYDFNKLKNSETNTEDAKVFSSIIEYGK